MNKRYFFSLICLIALTTQLFSDTAVPLEDEFYKDFYYAKSIQRDQLIENRLNNVVICTGVVQKVDEKGKYKRQYRAVIKDVFADKYDFNVYCYVYFANENTRTMMSAGEKINFQGQLVSYTPLNIKRNSYIYEILHESGSIIIE